MPQHLSSTSQRIAASSQHSAWVAASAGSGKTKVLTDRVLNLLLEGCAPERILCLTFTKAAAAEMANRVRMCLGEWAILTENELQSALETLQGVSPSAEKISRARTLFSLTLDTPGELKIQTIHSFCQSLLKRFPLEAGLSPFFEVMDNSEREALLKMAFETAIKESPSQILISQFSVATFKELNALILQERAKFETGVSPLLVEVNSLEIDPLFKDLPEAALRSVLPFFQEGSLTDQERGHALSQFLLFSKEERETHRDDYLSLFFTQKGEKKARLLTQKLAKAHPKLEEILQEEARRLEIWLEKKNAVEIKETSEALLQYSLSFLKAYEDLKKSQSALDYEDLIIKTVALLKNPGCHWVLYKLDGGIDHILVDEAQDTSPTQWEVIRALAEEFYANSIADTRNRTLFVVGDSKQSIYSFQGADPKIFAQMHKDLQRFAQNSGKPWQNVDLNVSFRSTPEILTVVDAVFTPYPFSSHSLQHVPSRKEASGHVEVWPLVKKEEEVCLEPWHPPLIQHRFDAPQKRLAHLIAKTVQGWLQDKGPLSRPVRPGDILILVRRRTSFVEALIRVFKDYNIPVAGVDRLWLLEGIGIQDLLKIGEFLLLPEDDLTLATVLKGPLFSLSEEDLFSLAYNRGQASLWQQLLKNEKFKEITDRLKDLLSRADFLTPFALYSYILGPCEGRKKWQAQLGPEVLDSLDEFLTLCLTFQEKKTPSLQGFLHWISHEVIELKRDLEQSNQIRVMTVHGSKGLQAPIVFLPDTTQPPLDLPLFAFEEEKFVWLPPSSKDIPLTKVIKQNLREKQLQEYRRLLYVAMTRAEDALYVCGWEGSPQETWYSLVVDALQKVGKEFDFLPVQGKGWRLSSLHEISTVFPKERKDFDFLLPQWLRTNPLPETPLKLLRPSQEDQDHEMTSSSFGGFGTERGTLIHKLLEVIPGVEEERRESVALRYLEKKGVQKELAFNIVSCVQEVVRAYPDLFDSTSKGEVPVMGYIGDALLSGQIDRLVIKEDQVLVVDFKTHTSVPESLKDIPTSYLKQMALYQAALSQIYPEKDIVCGLLWTHVPRLDLLPESVLKKSMPLIDGKWSEAYTR